MSNGLKAIFRITSKINDPTTYLDYCDSVHRHLDDAAKLIVWPAEFPESLSNVRKIEFCLYAYGKNRKSPK